MDAPRFALIAATALLALAACSDGARSEKKRSAPRSPFGFELAFAGASAAAESNDDTAIDAVPQAGEQAPVIDLTPDQLAARLAAGNVRLIDVRTDEEVAQGVIPGAEHIPLDRFDPAALGPSDGRSVVLYCRSGNRSAIAGGKLAEATGAPVEHLEGGILAWEEAGQPVAKR